MSVSLPRSNAWRLGALLLALTALKAWLLHVAGFELHYDEAQYWEWSQQLDWSYYSKGPLIAWLIALGEALFGHGEWQVRLFGWLAHAGFLALLYALTLEVWRSRRAAWWAVIIAAFSPLYFSLSLVMTTDNLLLLFWTWGLWAFYRALIRNQNRAWYESGAAIGLGALTKLSIGLLPLMLGLLVLLRPRWWHHLRNPHLWGALLLMLACMAPLLAWNAAHDWVMFRHELGHVDGDGRSLLAALEFLAGQWLALSPLVVIAAVMVLWRRPREEGPWLLWVLGLAWLGFFLFKAMNGKVQLNWAAPSYIGFIALFAGHVETLGRGARRLLYAGLVSGPALMLVAYFPLAFGLSGTQDPFHELRAWRTPIGGLAQQTPPGTAFLLTDTYQLAAELAFYWPQRRPVYITGSAARRFNQHDLWPGIEREAGRSGIYISLIAQPPELLTTACPRLVALTPVPARARDGAVLRTLYAWRCDNYQPIRWPRPVRY